ncbi:hypothetical protein F5Y04DRAFT_289098 [Hypomontagnella monticulosa]|nr:hypothetical protein F5Y04DRAFT_289098 [Hypomontagnella monticulosa]
MSDDNFTLSICLEDTTTATNRDTFPLSSSPIVKSSVRELYTFNSFCAENQSRHLNGPEPNPNSRQAAEVTQTNGSEYVFSAINSHPDRPQEPGYVQASVTVTESNQQEAIDLPNEENQGHESPAAPTPDTGKDQENPSANAVHFHFIGIPGHPPHMIGIHDDSLLRFNLPLWDYMDHPVFPFDNLCYAAAEVRKLDAVESSEFVTDIDTLWLIFSTLLDKVLGYAPYKAEHMKGFCIAVHIVGNTIFMKILNPQSASHVGPTTKAAAAHLKKHGIQWCETVNANCPPQGSNGEIQKQFKRVISYNLGGHRMVVEDGDQVLPTQHVCETPSDEDRASKASHSPEVPAADSPQYTTFHQKDAVKHQRTILFTAPAADEGLEGEDDDLMSRLWLSYSKAVMISLHRPVMNGAHMAFRRDILSFNPEENSRLADWATSESIEKTLKMLDRLLKHIKKAAAIHTGKGIHKFALRHFRQEHRNVVTSTKIHVALDLVSPEIARQIKDTHLEHVDGGLESTEDTKQVEGTQ